MKKPESYQVSLKVLLRNAKGETLILGALDNGTFAGYYDVPGGRIDTDEFGVDFVEILKREIREEIGDVELEIDPKPVALGRHLSRDLTAEGTRIPVLYLFFEAAYRGGDVAISHEHTHYRWVRLEEIDLRTYFTSSILEGVQMYLGQK